MDNTVLCRLKQQTQKIMIYLMAECWLDPEELCSKYYDMTLKGLDEKTIPRLYRANLLHGYYCPSKKKIFILEKSYLALLKHIFYTRTLQLQSLNEPIIKVSVPEYVSCKETEFRSIVGRDLVSIAELLDNYSNMNPMIFNPAFIRKLIELDILIWKWGKKVSELLVFLPSFDLLMEYRQFTLNQNIVLKKTIERKSGKQ